MDNSFFFKFILTKKISTSFVLFNKKNSSFEKRDAYIIKLWVSQTRIYFFKKMLSLLY